MTQFLGATQDKKDSDIIILGFPFDGTSSYRAGARFAPQSIREASQSIETYSPYQGYSLDKFSFYDAGDAEIPVGDTSATLKKIYDIIKENKNKFILSIGGEHLITYPIIKALREENEKIVLLDFDAHTDLRDEYLGVRLSHSTVIRRILELKNIHLITLGIRAGTEDEFVILKELNGIYSLSDIEKINEIISNNKTYITIDMDVFDPGYVPGVGNPEPAGIGFLDFINFIKNVSFKNVIGIDVVELNPVYDYSNISSIFAAEIIRELLIKIHKESTMNKTTENTEFTEGFKTV